MGLDRLGLTMTSATDVFVSRCLPQQPLWHAGGDVLQGQCGKFFAGTVKQLRALHALQFDKDVDFWWIKPKARPARCGRLPYLACLQRAPAFTVLRCLSEHGLAGVQPQSMAN